MASLAWGLSRCFSGRVISRPSVVFRRDPALGGLLVAYVVTAVAYNITEAGFRMLSLEWFFLLLSVVAANRVISLAETASESGRELAHADGRPWATRMSFEFSPTWRGSRNRFFARCRDPVVRAQGTADDTDHRRQQKGQ